MTGKAAELVKSLDFGNVSFDLLGAKPRIEIRGKITRNLVEEISRLKKEPGWVRRLRLRSLELFEKLPFREVAKGPVWKNGGAKVFHLAPYTRSEVVSKSISAEGGVAVYRALVKVARGAAGSVSSVQCDSLILDAESRAYTYPHKEVENAHSQVLHEASTGRLSEEVLFYLQSRGFSRAEAKRLVVLGFLGDLMGNLPFEYAIVVRRVIELEFENEGGVG